jgi:hypothetical protein
MISVVARTLSSDDIDDFTGCYAAIEVTVGRIRGQQCK